MHRFSAFCLHDLKNLTNRLSLVMQNAEEFRDEPAFQDSALRTVRVTIQKMTALMGKLSLKSTQARSVESVDVSTMIEETVQALQGDRRLEVIVSMTAVPPVSMARDHLQQVLLNLLLNARDAIADRGRITVHAAREHGSVVITVTDTGRGIPFERLQQVFRPLQSTKAAGLGIGLYQCKEIVEGYGGRIRIQSDEGRGTEVRIELPVAEQHAEAPVEV